MIFENREARQSLSNEAQDEEISEIDELPTFVGNHNKQGIMHSPTPEIVYSIKRSLNT